jgi:aerobic carbon-monoxide dehydrogenase medium subunit
MKPAAFDYLAARSLSHALELKAQRGEDARFLAGGQSLVPAMNFRLAQPSALIDLNGLIDLDYVRKDDGPGSALRIGALVRHSRLEHDALIAQHQPLLHEAVPHVAHPQIRNRGTLCGNLAHADPASEFPAVMLASGARLHAQSAKSERWIDARDFFLGIFTTALNADEMLTEVELPAAPPRTGTAFLEFARRRGDYAMMGLAAIVTLGEDGRCAGARLAYCSAGTTPVMATRAAAALLGSRGNEAVDEAAAIAQSEIDPLGGVHASKAYQRHLAGVLARRALAAAHLKAQGA